MRQYTRLRHASTAFAVLLLAAVTLIISACGTSSAAKSGPVALSDSQQVLHYTLVPGSNDIATMDPALVQDPYSGTPISLVFPGLVTLDAKLRVEPWAAAAMPTVNADGTVYTFTVRSGLQWSEGTPIDANTFAFAINRALNPCTASPIAYYLYTIKDAQTFSNETCKNGAVSGTISTLIGDSVVVQNPTTLVITLQQPAAYFLEALSYPASYAVPQNLVQQYGAKWTDHLADNGGFGGNFYKLTAWDHSGTLVVRRNDKFWGARPKLSEIDFTIFKSVETQYSDYLAGQHDFAVPPSSQFTQARTRPDFHETTALWSNYYAMNWTIAPFDDLRMRQAFAVALDKDALANVVLHGTVVPTNHIVPQGMPGYNASLEGPDGTQSLKGDPSKAQTLAQAYANDKCSGQISKCPKVVLTIPTGSQDFSNLAQASLAMWQQAMPGYPISVASVDGNTLLNELNTKSVQFSMQYWIADYPDPQDWLSLQFLPTAPYNNINVNEPDANTLITKADAEQDQSQRMTDYEAAEQLLVTAVGWAPLNQQKNFYEVRSYVENFTMDSEGSTPLDVWPTIYIAKH